MESVIISFAATYTNMAGSNESTPSSRIDNNDLKVDKVNHNKHQKLDKNEVRLVNRMKVRCRTIKVNAPCRRTRHKEYDSPKAYCSWCNYVISDTSLGLEIKILAHNTTLISYS